MINKCKKYLPLLVVVLVGQASCQWQSIKEDREYLLPTCDYEEKDQVKGLLLKHKFVDIEVALGFKDQFCVDYFFGLSSDQWEIYRQQFQQAASEGKDLFKVAVDSGFGSVIKTSLLMRRGCYGSGSFWFNLKHKVSRFCLLGDMQSFDALNKYYPRNDDHKRLRSEVEKNSSLKTKIGAYLADKFSFTKPCSAGVPVAVGRNICRLPIAPKKSKDDTVKPDTKIKPFAVRAVGVKPRDIERLPGQHVKLPTLKAPNSRF